ncbi:hypothetical protein FBU30_006660 [Linnemannia zychae]|nr:hypothetical protein FBU30_006660 [Linnemannia zychae]
MGDISLKHLPDITFFSTPSSFSPAAGDSFSTALTDTPTSTLSPLSTASSPSKDTGTPDSTPSTLRSFHSPPAVTSRSLFPQLTQSSKQNNSRVKKDNHSNNNFHIQGGNDNEISIVNSPHSLEPITYFSTSDTTFDPNVSMAFSTPVSLLEKPLPASPAPMLAGILSPSVFPEQETVKSHAHQRPDLSSPNSRNDGRINFLSQQSTHSQSSLSGQSITSNSSGNSGHGSNGTNGSGSVTKSQKSSSANTTVTRASSISGGTAESVGQLSLQRFPTGESEYKVKSMSSSGSSTRHSTGGDGNQTKASRSTSMVSTSSARSSSGSSGFKFTFKPLLHNHGNDGKQNHHLYHHHNRSSPSASANGHQQQQNSRSETFANSPFPAILLSIKLPQSLLDKYVIDQESFRHGKGIWGIGKYSWTITVLSRTNGKKVKGSTRLKTML